MNIAVNTATMKGATQGRALELLGSGVPQESVASALGVTPSYISQLLSDEGFAGEVTKLKYEALSKHTERDAAYDHIEDKLLEKMEKALPLMFRPVDISRALIAVNGAKRRGHDSKESIIAQQNIVEITMPVQIIQEFTTNIVNQVITAGDQDLTTIQSGELLKSIEVDSVEIIEESAHESQAEPKPDPTQETKLLENNTILDSL